MAKIDDREAYQIHVMACSDSDSDADVRGEFDEEYNLLKPPPLDVDEDQIVVISSQETLEINIWEQRLRNTQHDEENTKTQDESGAVIMPKKKRKKSKSNDNIAEAKVVEANKTKSKKKYVPLDLSTVYTSVEVNSVCELPEKKPKKKKGDKTNASKTDEMQLKDSDTSIPEHSDLKISYDSETLKKIREEINNLDEKKLWHYGLDNTRIVEELNTLRKKESEVLQSCLKPATTLQSTENKPKKKKKQKPVPEETNESSTGVKKVSRVVSPTMSTCSNSYLREFEYLFGDDFKEFIQSVVSDGTSIADLDSFTYEQLHSAYKAYQQKRAQNGYGFVAQNAPVRQIKAPVYHHGIPANAMFHQNYNAWNHPGYDNTMFHPSNIDWNYLGNPNTKMFFFFNPIPNPNCVTATSETLRLTEIGDGDEKASDVASDAIKKRRKRKKKSPQPVGTPRDLLGQEQDVFETNVGLTNGAQKTASGVTDILNIPSADGSNVTLENNALSKQKMETKQVVGEAVEGSAVLGVSQSIVDEKSEVKPAVLRLNPFYSKNFDAALSGFIQTFKEGENLIIEARQAERYGKVSNFSECHEHITNFLETNDTARAIVKRCLEMCTLIYNETGTDYSNIDDMRKAVAAAFRSSSVVLKDSIENVSSCESRFVEIYRREYNNLIRYVFVTRAGLLKCSQACDAINEEIEKSGWGGASESDKRRDGGLVPRLADANEGVKSSRGPIGEDRSALSSEEPSDGDYKRLLLGLGIANGSLKSSPKTEETSVISRLETKEDICGEREDNEVLKENLTLHDSWADQSKSDAKFVEVVYHLNRPDSDIWWCQAIFVILVAYLLIAALQGVVSFFHDNIYLLSMAFIIYSFLRQKK